MRGRGSFTGRPFLRPMRPVILWRRPLFRSFGCLGAIFPMLAIGAFALLVLTRLF